MNRWVLWTLVGVSALSAWALLAPRGTNESPLVTAVAHPWPVNAASGIQVSAASGVTVGTPAHWPAPDMDVAARSPFAAAPPPAANGSAPPAAPVAPPPPPLPPPAAYRFWGRMSSPDKHVLIFLAKGPDGAPTEVRQGTHLEDGWTVDSISDNAIVLANAATQQRTTIFVPPADAAATR